MQISVDVNAPVAGQLKSIEAAEGDTVYVGNKMFAIDTEGRAGVQAVRAEPESKSAETKTSKERGRIEKKTPLSRMRVTIGDRLKESQNRTVSLTTFQEVDMSGVKNARKKLGKMVQEKYNTKLGFMSFFLAASAKQLQKWPTVNSAIEGKNMLTRNYVDISVAVATPTGLMVPVVKDVEKKSLVELERDLAGLAKLARDGKLSLDTCQGGNFTISNGGIYGSLMGTPVINPPQSAILGMHGIVDKPVVRNGKVEIRPIMVLALTYDHKLIDGKEAVSFLKGIADLIENPEELLERLA